MMDSVPRHSWLRGASAPVAPLLALIVVLGVGGYILTSTTIRHDRDDAAERRARVEAVHAQEVLGRARAYVAGLAEVLAGEPKPAEAQFRRWAGATSASIGLNDVFWVERVASRERTRYERLRGVPITRLTASGQIVPAPPARAYLPATFTSQTRAELRPGVDVTNFPALVAALRDRARIFAVGASRPGALGDESGFYLLQFATFARGPGSRGYLVAFVPRGWFSTTLGGDPRRVAISEDGKRIEGQLGSVHARTGFDMLGRHWRVDVAREPPSRLQSMLPWLALAWPFAIAAIAFAIGRAVTQRRRAQRDVERLFELSTDLIGVVELDGRFRAVNPAFERTLGYPKEQIVGRPYSDFVHPDDLEAASHAFADILGGAELNQFEIRFIRSDGSERWLQWSARFVPEQGFVTGIARDVTEVRARAAEQAALRRVATLVAQNVPASELFDAVTSELGSLLGADFAGMIRFEDEATAGVVATWAADGEHPAVPERWQLEPGDPAALVVAAREPVRVEDWSSVPGPIAAIVRDQLGARSSVGCPIVVEGRLWGAVAVHAKRRGALPPGTEERIGQFADLVATAIANAEARAEIARLADEQAALRRVATLVAEGADPAALFAAVTQEVARLFRDAEPTVNPTIIRFDPGPEFVLVGEAEPMYKLPLGSRWPPKHLYVSTRVFRSGRSAHVDKEEVDADAGPDADLLRRQGIHYQVGSPIVVQGHPWGAMTMNSSNPLPPDTGKRLENFTELLATAISNTAARAEVERLAQEQALLRGVATLVAREAPRAEIFAAIADAGARMLGIENFGMVSFEGEEQCVVANSGKFEEFFPLGMRTALTGDNASTRVFRTGRPARIDEYERTTGPISEAARSAGTRSAVAVPIVVEGRLWGAMVAGSDREEPLPQETELRLGQFTDLMATAIANTQARGEVERLAEEQAALRRVATLVASAARPSAVFAAVVEEVGRLLAVDQAFLTRFDGGGKVTVIAGWRASGELPAAELPLQVPAGPMSIEMAETGAPVRLDPYPGDPNASELEGDVHSTVAAPVTVKDSLWGFISVAQMGDDPPPPETELRLARFTELVATAIANAESREAVEHLAEEQAALRRVATLIAEGASSAAVFDAVAGELEGLLGADGVTLSRYEPDDEAVVVAHSGSDPRRVPPGTRVRHRGENVTSAVRRSKRAARVEHQSAQGPIAELARNHGVRASVGAPIVVEGKLWGVAIANWRGDESPPADTEERMAKFADLLEIAIATADSRDQLTASRVRLVTEADDARRRVVRDLHDGAQQRLVHSIITLKLAQRALAETGGEAKTLVDEALQQAEQGNVELRELAHGILPSVLTRGGLVAGVDTVVSRLELPVDLDITAERFPAEIEASAYFIIAEALTNVVKHAHATRAEVTVRVEDEALHIDVRDDGIGGANPEGHGLVGLADRATALGGRLEVHRVTSGGTLVAATLPLRRAELSEPPARRPAAPR
jgi:PAS domain S-box-containing protein